LNSLLFLFLGNLSHHEQVLEDQLPSVLFKVETTPEYNEPLDDGSPVDSLAPSFNAKRQTKRAIEEPTAEVFNARSRNRRSLASYKDRKYRKNCVGDDCQELVGMSHIKSANPEYMAILNEIKDIGKKLKDYELSVWKSTHMPFDPYNFWYQIQPIRTTTPSTPMPVKPSTTATNVEPAESKIIIVTASPVPTESTTVPDEPLSTSNLSAEELTVETSTSEDSVPTSSFVTNTPKDFSELKTSLLDFTADDTSSESFQGSSFEESSSFEDSSTNNNDDLTYEEYSDETEISDETTIRNFPDESQETTVDYIVNVDITNSNENTPITQSTVESEYSYDPDVSTSGLETSTANYSEANFLTTEMTTLLNNQTEITNLPVDQTEITTVLEDQTEITNLPEDLTELTTLPEDQTEVLDDLTEITTLPNDQTVINTIPGDQTEILGESEADTSSAQTTLLTTGFEETVTSTTISSLDVEVPMLKSLLKFSENDELNDQLLLENGGGKSIS